MGEKLIIAAVLLALGAGAGALVNGWRLSGDLAAKDTTIAQLRGANTALEAANKQCAVNVDDVRKAVTGVVGEAKRVNDAALAAMNRAAGKAAKHQAKADEILSRPPVPPAEWCNTIKAEQTEHVEARRKGRP